MKNISKILSMMICATLVVTSCQEDTPELSALPDKSDIDFQVTQDLVNDPGGNTVILRNNTPETVAMWDYGTGRSSRVVDTVYFPFKGEYTIKFSALTGGGVVEMDPVKVVVTDDNVNHIKDPMWQLLAGSIGGSKTWVLDINATYFDGPLFFYGTNNGWEGKCMVDGGDCWNWNPDYAGNSWLMDGGDYGTMTFSLITGPYVTVEHKKLPARGTEDGTYYLDPEAKTLLMTDATPLHDSGRDGCVDAWGKIKLLSLDEDHMQFAVLRTSCEGPCLLVYNYVPKE